MRAAMLSPLPASPAASLVDAARFTPAIMIAARNKDELHPEMQANVKAFEKELKCPICFEYVDDAVTPPCHHLFCRKCIVHAIERKSTCPVCGIAIQRGLRSLEAQPWTHEVISRYRLTLQEVFRDHDTDFLFSQVPTGGFAAFQPPVPSPKRSRFLPAAAPHIQTAAIPPPPVPSRSLGGRRQLGLRSRAAASGIAASAVAAASPAAAAAGGCDEFSETNGCSAPLGQKRDRAADTKQVTFASSDCLLPQQVRLASATAAKAAEHLPSSSNAPVLAAAKSISAYITAPATSAPQQSCISSSALTPSLRPTPSLFSNLGPQRSYGTTARQPIHHPQAVNASSSPYCPTAVAPRTLSEQPELPAQHPSPASSATPAKSSRATSAPSAAATPSTEPRVSRGTGSVAASGSSYNFRKGYDVFACTTLSEGDRDLCEAVLRMGGFHLGSDLEASKASRNVLVITTEADSSSSSSGGFKVVRATSKLWNCLAMGGMVISHTWLFACMTAGCLVSPFEYTVFHRRHSSFSPLKGWQIFVDLPAPKKAQVETTCKLAGATVLKRMPSYAETATPLKAKLKGLEIDMHGFAPVSTPSSFCRCRSSSYTLLRDVTGRGTGGHIARLVREEELHLSRANKVMTVGEDWLQVPLLCLSSDCGALCRSHRMQRGLQSGSLLLQ